MIGVSMGYDNNIYVLVSKEKNTDEIISVTRFVDPSM